MNVTPTNEKHCYCRFCQEDHLEENCTIFVHFYELTMQSNLSTSSANSLSTASWCHPEWVKIESIPKEELIPDGFA